MKRSLTSLLILVILLRLVVFLGLHVWSVSAGREGFSPVVLGGDDGEYYYATALAIADGNNPGIVVNVYPVLLGGLIRITGITDIFWLKLLNVIVGCGAIIMGMLLYLALVRSHAIVVPGLPKMWSLSVLILLLGLYPSAIWNTSASLYRDAWLFFLHMAGIYTTFLFIQCKKPSNRVRYAIISTVVICALFAFRWYAGLSLLLGMLAWLGLRQRTRSRYAHSALFTTFAVVALIIMIFIGARTLGLMPKLENLNLMAGYRTGDMASGSGLGINLFTAPVQMILPFYAYSFISNLLGPLPWQINSMSTLVGFLIEGPMLIIITYGLWKRRRHLDQNAWYLLCQALVWMALISFSNDNLGTALRLRVIGWQCLFVLYAYLLYKTPVARHGNRRGDGVRPLRSARV